MKFAPKARLWASSRKGRSGEAPRSVGTDWIASLSLSPDGKRALTGSTDSSVRVWDLASGKELAVLAHARYLYAWYTPDGRHFVIWSREGLWRLWDATKFKEVRTWKTPDAMQVVALFFADARQVEMVAKNAAGEIVVQWWDWERDEPVRVLKLEPGELRASLEPGKVKAPHFSADGRRLLYASTADETVRYLDLVSGKEIVSFNVPGRVPMGLALSPDGRHAAGATGDGWVYLWRLPEPPPEKVGDGRRPE